MCVGSKCHAVDAPFFFVFDRSASSAVGEPMDNFTLSLCA